MQSKNIEEIKLKKVKHKDCYIYFFSKEYEELGKNIVDKEINIKKILKDSKRNYVCLIEYKGKSYVFKEPRNEYRIIQRKIMTFFKRGESLSTLINVNEAIDIKKINNFARPLIAVVQRRYGLITYSALVMENIKEKEEIKEKYVDEIINLMKKVHSSKIYHGDFNLSNFLIDENNNIRIIDTQAKKMLFGNYRAHYDMLTMKIDTYNQLIYPYKKNIFYYMALGIKKFKKISFVKKIGEIRGRLRDKK